MAFTGHFSNQVRGGLSRQFVAGLALVAATIGSVGSVGAQAWPVKPIRAINPFPAGGGTDTFARPWAAELTQALGQTMIIENQGGAGGTLGASNAAKTAGDGYTLFVDAIHHTIAESLYAKLPYSLERDFVPITVLAYVPNVVVVHPKHPFKTLQELIAFARANPGRLNFGSAGNGTSHHMGDELFRTLTGAQITHVPYRGAGPMMQDLLAGMVDMAFDGMGTSATQIKAEKLRPLAVTTAERSPVLPDTPTMGESGYKRFELTTWYGLWAPRGTPKEVVDRIHAETAKFLQLPCTRELWASQGAEAGGQSPAEFERFVKTEITKWSQVVRAANLRIDY